MDSCSTFSMVICWPSHAQHPSQDRQETCYTHSLTPQLVSRTLNENFDHLIDNHLQTWVHISHVFAFFKCFGTWWHYIISMKNTWWHYIISMKNRNSKLFKFVRRRYIYWHLHTNWDAAILWVITTLVLMRCQRII
jgi:hypothetical protein